MTSLNTARLLRKTLLPHITEPIRRIAAALFGVYAWTVFALIAAAAYLLIMLPHGLSRRRLIARQAARLAFRCTGYPLKVTGLEDLPGAPHILIVNHTSFIDAIALTALLPAPPGYAFTARQQFRQQGVFCPLLRALGLVVLRRYEPQHLSSNIELITRTLRQGERVVMFPEGGFVAAPGLRRFHAGAFVAATRADVPIVVGALRGARRALPPRTWLPCRTGIELKIGPVLSTSGTDRASIAALREEARRLMLPMTEEPDTAS